MTVENTDVVEMGDAASRRISKVMPHLSVPLCIHFSTVSKVFLPPHTVSWINLAPRAQSLAEGWFLTNTNTCNQLCIFTFNTFLKEIAPIRILMFNPQNYPVMLKPRHRVLVATPYARMCPENETLSTNAVEPSSTVVTEDVGPALVSTAVSEVCDKPVMHAFYDDIRLTPAYTEAIEKHFGVDRKLFADAFYYGGNYAKQHWLCEPAIWINPPWTMLRHALRKLLADPPQQFLFIGPVYETQWSEILRQLPGIRELSLDRNIDENGCYRRYVNDEPGQLLPHPDWDTLCFYGTGAQLLSLNPSTRQMLTRLLEQTVFKTEKMWTLPEVTPMVGAVPTVMPSPVDMEHLPPWIENLCIGELTAEQRTAFIKTMLPYACLLDGTCLGLTDAAECDIPTDTATPIHARPYSYSAKERVIIQTEIAKYLQAGIIKESTSPWSSPVVLVTKKDGTIRFCVDYRRLNQHTTSDVYPLPRIDDTLDALGGNMFFTSLDLKSGYHQVKMKASDGPKTAFITHQGLYEFTRAPFGLKNMPAIFQRLMNTTLAGLTWSHCLVYIDDCIIFAKTFEEHLSRLDMVLSRFKDAHLTLNVPKCRFLVRELDHLGHVISTEGIKPNPEKVAAVHNFRVPSTTQHVQSFLGLTGWFRKFIPKYAVIAAPLLALAKKSAVFEWTPACLEAFQKLQQALTNPPLLVFPDTTKPYVLNCDASDYQVGAVLLQPYDKTLKPILYLSHTLGELQRKYTVTEKEWFAVVYAVGLLRKYLRGQRFLVMSDHTSLQWLYKNQAYNSRLMRWAVLLNEYDFTVCLSVGQVNGAADAMSRLISCTTPLLPTNAAHEFDQDGLDVSLLEAVPNTMCPALWVRAETAVADATLIGRYLRIPGPTLKFGDGPVKSTKLPVLCRIVAFRADRTDRSRDTWMVQPVSSAGHWHVYAAVAVLSITRFLIPYGCEVRHLTEKQSADYMALVVTRAKSAAIEETAPLCPMRQQFQAVRLICQQHQKRTIWPRMVSL